MMKVKFFIIGFLSAIAITGISIFGFVKYIENKQQTAIAKELKKDFNDFDISILNIDKSVFESLSFSNIITNKKVEKFEKRYIFVNFWATWCGPCIGEMPELVKLTHDPEIKSLPIQFVFSSDEDKEKITSFAEKKNFDLNFTKTNGKLPSVISLETVPVTYIFDTRNNLAYKIVGMQSWNSTLIKSFLKSIN